MAEPVSNVVEIHERKKARRRNGNADGKDIMVIDTGGGCSGTITSRAWQVTHRTNRNMAMSGYQDDRAPKVHPIVNGITKATFTNREQPVIICMNYATLIDDNDELESLSVPFNSMRLGLKVGMTPRCHGGVPGFELDGELFEFDYDDEKLCRTGKTD